MYNGHIKRLYVCVSALDPFPTLTEPQVHRPRVGSSLTLRCNPPHSYPPGHVYWADKGGTQLRPLETTDRVSLDYEGSSAFHCAVFSILDRPLCMVIEEDRTVNK